MDKEEKEFYDFLQLDKKFNKELKKLILNNQEFIKNKQVNKDYLNFKYNAYINYLKDLK